MGGLSEDGCENGCEDGIVKDLVMNGLGYW